MGKLIEKKFVEEYEALKAENEELKKLVASFGMRDTVTESGIGIFDCHQTIELFSIETNISVYDINKSSIYGRGGLDGIRKFDAMSDDELYEFATKHKNGDSYSRCAIVERREVWPFVAVIREMTTQHTYAINPNSEWGLVRIDKPYEEDPRDNLGSLRPLKEYDDIRNAAIQELRKHIAKLADKLAEELEKNENGDK